MQDFSKKQQVLLLKIKKLNHGATDALTENQETALGRATDFFLNPQG